MRVGQTTLSKTQTGKNTSSKQTIQRQSVSKNKNITKSEVSQFQWKVHQFTIIVKVYRRRINLQCICMI